MNYINLGVITLEIIKVIKIWCIEFIKNDYIKIDNLYKFLFDKTRIEEKLILQNELFKHIESTYFTPDIDFSLIKPCFSIKLI